MHLKSGNARLGTPTGGIPSATQGHSTAASITMKKAYLLLSLLAVSLFSGCGGPKYAAGFKEWLSMDLAKRLPVKLAWVKIEKLSSGKTQAVFKFTSEIQFTENLYGPATPVDTAPATAALQKMKEANVPVPQQNEVIKIYNSITILPLFKITTPEGKRIPMSGKAQATLQNNGEWQYELLDVVGGNYEGGKEPTGKWALEGSKEAKENAAAVQEKVGAVVAAADKAIQDAREVQIREEKFAALVQKKEAEAAKAMENAFLAFCDDGQVVYGSWTSDTASGDIGIRWGQRTKDGEGYSIAGVFFDPDNQKYQKPFTGRITIPNIPNVPYKLELKAIRGKGVQINDDLWFSVIGAQGRKAAIDAGVFDKTPVLLLERFSYNVVLGYNPSGELQGTSDFDSTGVQRPRYQFCKSYSPRKGMPETDSSFRPNPSPTGSEQIPVGNGDTPQTQQGTVSTQQMQDADAELNSTYQQLLAMLNPSDKERLKGLQRDWLKKRDAAVAANPTNAAAINLQATLERTAALRQAIQKVAN